MDMFVSYLAQFRICCCCWVAKLSATLCNPKDWKHTRLPCTSLSPWVCSDFCPLSQWCHPTISSSVTLFFSCPQSFPASGSLAMSRLSTSGGQNIGTSASELVLPMILGGFPLGLTDLLAVQGTLKSLSSSAPQFESINYLALCLLYSPTHIHT